MQLLSKWIHVLLFETGLGSIQFRNWNCSSIPIPILELNWNWNWNWWNWKWNWNWKPWNWNCNCNWKPKLNFSQLLLQQLLVNQPFPNFGFSRGGHNLSCHRLYVLQVFLGHCPPCGVVTKDTWAGYLVPTVTWYWCMMCLFDFLPALLYSCI